MTGSIGLGLLVNVLVWTVAVLVAVGLASLAVVEWFPGREAGTRKPSRARQAGGKAAEPRKKAPDEEENAEPYRKAS